MKSNSNIPLSTATIYLGGQYFILRGAGVMLPPRIEVKGGGNYSLDDVYTTNPEDMIINLVRNFYPDTLPANVTAYDNPDSWIDHEFVETYLA